MFGAQLLFTIDDAKLTSSHSRLQIRDNIVRTGSIPVLGVTKRTNVLVVGDINRAVLLMALGLALHWP